jgi:hypothetical protein
MRTLAAIVGMLLLGTTCGKDPAVGIRNVDGGGADTPSGGEAGRDALSLDAPGPDAATMDAAATVDIGRMDAPTTSFDGLPGCSGPGDCPGGWLCCADCQGRRFCNAACTGEVCPRDAGTDAGFACGSARCEASQICVQDCTCGGPIGCIDKGDAATCPGAPCPGVPTSCMQVCNNPPPRCLDLPVACNGTPSNACLFGNPCHGNLVSERRYMCSCAP